MFRVFHAFLSVNCSLVVICWERANLLALLCVMLYCVFVTFLCSVLGQVWYLIVWISDLCLRTYFDIYSKYDKGKYNMGLLLFDLILNVPSTIFQL